MVKLRGNLLKSRAKYRILAGAAFVASLFLMCDCISYDVKDRYDYPENSTDITLCINEVLYSNLGYIKDEDGDRSDYIEIYNYGDKRVNLKGISLADHRGTKGRWYFPETDIEAGDYLVVWASGKDKVTANGEIHTDFMVNNSDTITLYDLDNECIDEFYFDGTVDTGVSVGRVEKHPAELALFAANTPGAPNNAQKISLITRIDDSLGIPEFSRQAGIYDEEFELVLSAGEGEKILYTLDGSEPTYGSKVYEGPIQIKDRSAEPNTIGNIKTTINYSMYYTWENDYTYKGTVVKARIMKDGVLSDETATASYFISPDTSFNIISLSVDPDKMFDEWDGLYVPGETYYVWKKYNRENYWSFSPGNYNSDEKLKAHIEIFGSDGNLRADNNVGISMMGAASRKSAAKGIKVDMDETRSSFSGRMFELLPVSDGISRVGMDAIALRAAGTEFNWTMFADILAQSLVSDKLEVTTQAAQQAVLFINGEFWGIHNIRETYNADYFFRHYGIEEKNLALIKLNLGVSDHEPEITIGTEQDLQDYLDLIDYVQSHDLSDPDCYKYVCDRIDVDAFIDYYVVQMYLGNDDWPGNNYRIYRADQTGFDKGDNRWRPVLFDLDNSFRYIDFNTIDYVLNEEYDEESVKSIAHFHDMNRELIQALIQNEEFKNKFFDRFEKSLDTVFSSDNVLEKIDRFADLYRPEMDDQYTRWHTKTGWFNKIKLLFHKGSSEEGRYSVETWEDKVEGFRTFAKERPDKLRDYITQYLDED